MKYREIGKTCDLAETDNTFYEIAEISKNNGIEMFQKDDKPHPNNMKEMMTLISSSNAIQNWFEAKGK